MEAGGLSVTECSPLIHYLNEGYRTCRRWIGLEKKLRPRFTLEELEQRSQKRTSLCFYALVSVCALHCNTNISNNNNYYNQNISGL